MYRVALFRYASALNESTDDRALRPFEKPNSKDQLDRLKNPSTLSTTSQFYVEPIWDCIDLSHLTNLSVHGKL